MEFLKNKVVPVFVINELDNIIENAEKLISDGYDVFEITLRTDCAFDAIKILKIKYPNLIVGAGTVLSTEHLIKAIECGADFGVAPGLNPDVVKKALSLDFPFIPGIATATEIEQAISLGLNLVKVFPAKVLGGIDFIKAISAPYRKIKFMPTGGITDNMAADYLAIDSVWCVGGTWMTKF